MASPGRRPKKPRKQVSWGYVRTLLYRSHQDFVVHLAVEIAQLSAAEISLLPATADLKKAATEDLAEARAILERAGIRLRDDSPPAWHFNRAAFSRCTEPTTPESEAKPDEPQPSGDVPLG